MTLKNELAHIGSPECSLAALGFPKEAFEILPFFAFGEGISLDYIAIRSQKDDDFEEDFDEDLDDDLEGDDEEYDDEEFLEDDEYELDDEDLEYDEPIEEEFEIDDDEDFEEEEDENL